MKAPPLSPYHAQHNRWTDRAADWVSYAAARSVGFAMAPFPLWRGIEVIATLGRWIIPRLPGPGKRLSDNLARVYPDRAAAARRAIAADAAAHFTRLCIEYLNLRRFADEVTTEVEGMERLIEARTRGKGVVLVTAHYGNWEALRLACLRAGHECGIIYRPFNNRYVDRYTLSLIRLCGEPVMQKGPRGMRALTGHIAKGGVALVLVDQRTTGAPLLPFLGHQAETLTVAAALARRSGATLITARARRMDNRGRFHVRLEAPVPEDTPEAMMTEVNRRIGTWIEEDPGQWFWVHRRWRRAG
ncbi:MAG: lysophospholipid acyltransferase family protein [Pseudomonadota bacterium]